VTIAPSDAAVAARSFPRRWRGLFARAAGDDDHADVLERSGAMELAAAAARVLANTADALPGTVHGVAGIGGDVLDRLASAADALARTIESVPPDDWAGAPIVALTDGIDRAATLLRQAERAVDDALAA
jgi:hypothetical protein